MRANQSNSNCKAKRKTKSVIKYANNSNKLNKLPMTFSHRTNGTTTKLLKNVFTFTSARVCVCDLAVTHWLAVRNRLFQQIEKKSGKKLFQNFSLALVLRCLLCSVKIEYEIICGETLHFILVTMSRLQWKNWNRNSTNIKYSKNPDSVCTNRNSEGKKKRRGDSVVACD